MKYKAAMASLIGMSAKSKRHLVSAFGSEYELFHASDKLIDSLGFIHSDAREYFKIYKKTTDIDKCYDNLIKSGVSLVTYFDLAYPVSLKKINDPPYCLFYKGRLPAAEERCVAMVGARRCSAYGKNMAKDIAYDLSKNGFNIVSGMARGIDGESHRGALLAKGPTIAVLGCGVDICYPKENDDIYNNITKNGCILSEYAPGTAPLSTFFPLRNRIISGLSEAVIVVEAREKSGSLITADLALEQGRDVYALPGRVTDAMSGGTNALIAEGAGIIRSKENLVSMLLGIEKKERVCFVENMIRPDLEDDEKRVYECFDFYARSIDSVQKETGFDLLKLLSLIMNLCEKGLIRESFKNEYIRLA